MSVDDLVAWGRIIALETRGRSSSLWRRAAIGFIEEPDGSLLVSASDDTTQWALNLIADPRCRVEREGMTVASSAELLAIDQGNAVSASLILKYGTPAEAQSGGPAFRITPAAESLNAQGRD
jgi:deazaflavin-dependent oxidoreductase (nitroreductase family)